MSRSVPALVAVALGAFVASCSLVVDFDRSKVHEGSGGRASTGGRPSAGTPGSGGEGPDIDASMGGNPDSGAGGSVNTGGDGGGGEAGDSGADSMPPKPACDVDTNNGCAANELCCEGANGPACHETSVDECAACGTACSQSAAVACVGRSCECAPGSKKACSGVQGLCSQVGNADAKCVECRDLKDCASASGGRHECIAGKCVECDPGGTNAGCGGNKPICDPATQACKGCSTANDDCGGTLKCTAGGGCGGCASSSSDCVTPTTPICDAISTQCRACTGNAECASERGLAFCVPSGRCAPCDPQNDSGCADATKPSCRPASNNEYTCQACTIDDHCKNHAGTPFCNTSTGQCAACASDNDCTANAKKPLCVNNQCAACDTAPSSGADSRCGAKPGGASACIRSGAHGGECGACDPGSSAGCSSSQLCCAGTDGPACAGTGPSSQCESCGTACDSTLADGCSSRGCKCGSGPACSGSGSDALCIGGSCVECGGDGDCSGSKNKCDLSTHACVTCLANGDCNGTAPICASDTCHACGSDAECAMLTGSVPLCGSDGSCGADPTCSGDQDCTDGVHTVCAETDSGSGERHCRVCDPSNNAGCQGADTCTAAFVCAP